MNGKCHPFDFWNRLEAVANGNEDFSWTSDDGIWIHKEFETWMIEKGNDQYFQNMYIQDGDYFSGQHDWVSEILDRLEAAELPKT